MDYAWHYNELVCQAKDRILPKGVYTEKHHIKPKCLGGGNERENIAVLTAREHLLAHLLLVKMYPGNPKLVYAAAKMFSCAPNHKRPAIRGHAWLRSLNAKAMSDRIVSAETRVKMGNAKRGIVPSIDTRAKMSVAKKGKRHTEEAKANMSAAGKGRKHTEEAKAKISAGHKGHTRGVGRLHTEEAKEKMSASLKMLEKIECPHCDEAFNPGNFAAWHGDNCRALTGVSARPATEESRQHLSDIAKNSEKIPCDHCDVMSTPGNFARWHGDNCKALTGVSAYQPTDELRQRMREIEKIPCDHCDVVTTPGNHARWHGDNCKMKLKKAA